MDDKKTQIAGLTGKEKWLYENRSLRMDANKTFFHDSRRKFHLQRYHFAAKYCTDKKVLDAACGTGYGSSLMSKDAKSADGVDLCQEAVDYATELYATEKIKFHKSSVELMPFNDNYFDLIASFETVEHVLSPRSAIMEFARVLNDDGKAIISIPNEWGYTKDHFFDFNFDMLLEILEEYFSEYSFYYQNSGDKKKRRPKGIGPLESIPCSCAECILAICSKPKKQNICSDKIVFMLDDIYKNSFERHHAFVKLYRRQYGPFTKMIRRFNKKRL